MSKSRQLVESLTAENPYGAVCPVCSSPATDRCRCRGPHTMEDLKKGHGLKCKNGHRWSGEVVLS